MVHGGDTAVGRVQSEVLQTCREVAIKVRIEGERVALVHDGGIRRHQRRWKVARTASLERPGGTWAGVWRVLCVVGVVVGLSQIV
jgi:hypothetical protein